MRCVICGTTECELLYTYEGTDEPMCCVCVDFPEESNAYKDHDDAIVITTAYGE